MPKKKAKKGKVKIKKSMMMGKLLETYPKLAEHLSERYGLHCMGCPMAAEETLEEGLAVHGFCKREIEGIVAELEELV